jgi:uncharacterized protein involved in exopolysaccharide biosynthesis
MGTCRSAKRVDIMTKRVVRRLLETFFRRWWIYLLPAVLFVGVGVAQASGGSNGFRSVGVLSVAPETVLSQITQIRGEGFGYETPASATSRTINSLLGTESFMTAVVEKAGVEEELAQGLITPLELRQAIFASPGGDQLVQVVGTTELPDLSAALVMATIDSYREYVVEGKVLQSRAAEEVFTEEIREYEAQVEAADQALATYARNHGGDAPLQDRPLYEQIELEQLQSNRASAEARLGAAEQKLSEAKSVTAQAEADVYQRLRLHDEPRVPLSPESQTKKQVMTVMMFTFVGLLLTAGLVALGVVTDRTLRAADDVTHLLGVRVIAVVPDIAA